MSPGLWRRQHQNASQDPVGLLAEQAPARLLGVSPARSGRAPLTSCSLSWAHGKMDTSKLSTSDLDTGQERRPHGAAGDRCHRREAKKQSVCCHPKKQVCWPAGQMEQMALKKAGLLRRGGPPSVRPWNVSPRPERRAESREWETGTRRQDKALRLNLKAAPPRSPNRTQWTIQQTPLGAAGGPRGPEHGRAGRMDPGCSAEQQGLGEGWAQEAIKAT